MFKFSPIILFSFVFFLLSSALAGIINVPGDQPTIQAGINAVLTGDTVLVADGLYYENISFKGKAITVASQYLLNGNLSHVDNTIIDGSQSSHPDTGSVVRFVSGEDTNSVLSGFTITGGIGTIVFWLPNWPPDRTGAGVLAFSGAKIENNKIINNNITVTGNTTASAAGIAVLGDLGDNIIIRGNQISQNTATAVDWIGGAVVLATEETCVFENNQVTHNTCNSNTVWGAGICIDGLLGAGPYLIRNNVIRNNEAPGTSANGGGIWVRRADVEIVNNTIVNNTVGRYGGAIAAQIQSNINIINTIIWGNSTPAFYMNGGNIEVRYSNIQEGWGGEGNITSDPLFIGPAAGNYHIANISPCSGTGIDSIQIGSNRYYAPSYDLEGNPRPAPPGTRPDMGAYENQNNPPRRVPENYASIQAGIDAAENGDVVLVADSTYYENINFKGKAITVASHFLVDGDTNHINNTIIDGSQPSNPDSGSVVLFVSGEDTNSVLNGFTITNGTGTITGPPYNYSGGGGIFCSNSGSRIEFNKIINNSVDYSNEALGGGISADAQNTVYIIIEHNQVRNNSVTGVNGAYGGGMEIINSNGKILGNDILNNSCVSTANQANSGGIGCWSNSLDTPFVAIIDNQISHNTASGVDVGNLSGAATGGLGIFGLFAKVEKNNISYNVIHGSQDAYGAGIGCGDVHDNLVIDGNYIAENVIEHGTGWGGGLCIFRASATVINNIIVNNSAAAGSESYGGGIWIRGNSTANILNNTILFNVANEGGGINSRNSNTKIMNTILWGDSSTIGHHELQWSGGSFNVVYSDVEGGWTGDGNISKEPMLRGDSLVLSDSSSCIGAGTLSYIFGTDTIACPSICYLGHARPFTSGLPPDMGACESPLDSPVVGLEKPFSDNLPRSYDLKQNYPNPFNPSTTIEFALPHASEVTLKIYNILGEVVETLVSERLTAGKYEYQWYPRDLASGVYFYTLAAADYIQTRKLILLR